ncbi:hypothetical protein MIND_00696100 [Mycena indigotica]|uniref:Uncharacterized protein n=1 Tax=Mycena indigotica TaxID=2126181 RepID=A0A8H6SKB9_9AGAR|nr:uncharacterized protein MIND_00696100 [Mycena indigotica]KAF7301310.1 hypothetical protein MIND_00696100 [Mycena indigotica]
MKLAAFVISLSLGLANSEPLSTSNCRVQAWVRAEDLAPETTSHGELRIKVAPANCASKVASVALRLSLDEFAEVKHLRRGAQLPQIVKADNQTRPDSADPWMFQTRSQDKETVYNYTAYDHTMSDPAFWIVKAEQRKTWTTERTLFGDDQDFTKPQVTPFVVVSPAVNFPPAVPNRRGGSSGGPIRGHADSDLGYHYVAIVTFADGSIVEKHAGHTNFVPRFAKLKPTKEARPFVATEHFIDKTNTLHQELPAVQKDMERRERCFPAAERSVYVASIKLDHGNVVQKGQKLKGRVFVRGTAGSTTMSRISVQLHTIRTTDWAQREAFSGGDREFVDPNQLFPSDQRTISAASGEYLFHDHGADDPYRVFRSTFKVVDSGVINNNKPYFDFSLDIPDDIMPTFTTYYGSTAANLTVALSAVYSREIARCLRDTIPSNEDNLLDLDDASRCLKRR